jgi:hypothetical protein
MKNILLIVLLSLLFMACKKESVEPSGSSSTNDAKPKVTGTMKAILDGTPWEAKSVNFNGTFALITFSGKDIGGNDISFQFVETNLQLNKIYDISLPSKAGNLDCNVIYALKATDPHFGVSGQLKISKYVRGKEIAGEFSFVCDNFINKKFTFTNGEFSMKYQ